MTHEEYIKRRDEILWHVVNSDRFTDDGKVVRSDAERIQQAIDQLYEDAIDSISGTTTIWADAVFWAGYEQARKELRQIVKGDKNGN